MDLDTVNAIRHQRTHTSLSYIVLQSSTDAICFANCFGAILTAAAFSGETCSDVKHVLQKYECMQVDLPAFVTGSVASYNKTDCDAD